MSDVVKVGEGDVTRQFLRGEERTRDFVQVEAARHLSVYHLYLALNRCASSCRWHNSVSFSTIRLRVDSGTTSSTHMFPTSSGSRSSFQTPTYGFSMVNGLSGFAQTTAAWIHILMPSAARKFFKAIAFLFA